MDRYLPKNFTTSFIRQRSRIFCNDVPMGTMGSRLSAEFTSLPIQKETARRVGHVQCPLPCVELRALHGNRSLWLASVDFCIRGDSNHMHRHVPDARCAESRYEIFRVFAMAGLRRRSICLWRDAWWGTCSLVPCSKCRVLCTFDIAWGLGYLSSSFQKSKFQIAIHDATDRRVSLNDPRRLLLSYIHSTTTFFFVL